MFKNFLKEIEERLKKQKTELEAQLEKLGERSKRFGNGFEVDFPDFGDKEDEMADEVSAFGDRLSLGSSLEKSLEEVNLALEKIKKGTYGICEKCGQKIDEKRLRALPTAKYCLTCKK
ncbi:MAG: TraR/DksA C4-type zinc finger protein [Patescibacteria group bacterium]|nr:TraR/DksA C4-type zinc finger protein [Patescibacteria group bacterium]